MPRPAATVASAQLKPPKVSRGGPLEGVRVVELTKVWAGPYAGKLLALLGAEVIKVESSGHPEEMRAYGGTDINHAPFFLSINPEILSVELDIKSADDVDRLRELIAAQRHRHQQSAAGRDGAAWGSATHDLKTVKQDIISVSIKMWGNDGPLGYQTGYAPCFAALAGVASLVGYAGGPPLGTSMRYGDSTVGAAAAFAAVAALLHRDLTGEGQFVDVSAVETLSSMIGDCLLAQELTGTQLCPTATGTPTWRRTAATPAPMATGSASPSPTRRSGVSCVTCSVPARWLDDARYTTLADRLTHTEVLDLDLADFTRHHDAASWRSGCKPPVSRPPRAPPRWTSSATRCSGTASSTASSAITARGSVRCSQRHGGCRGRRPRSPAEHPTSASTTTMFVTRSSVVTRWRNDD